MTKHVDVLGTKYHITRVRAEEIEEGFGGFCDPDLREIKILRLETLPEWKEESAKKRAAREKECLRHEIVHAFLFESGLGSNAGEAEMPWPLNEEMVDWMAIQGPKIYSAWEKAGAL